MQLLIPYRRVNETTKKQQYPQKTLHPFRENRIIGKKDGIKEDYLRQDRPDEPRHEKRPQVQHNECGPQGPHPGARPKSFSLAFTACAAYSVKQDNERQIDGKRQEMCHSLLQPPTHMDPVGRGVRSFEDEKRADKGARDPALCRYEEPENDDQHEDIDERRPRLLGHPRRRRRRSHRHLASRIGERVFIV